jgi:hypothetical protein
VALVDDSPVENDVLDLAVRALIVSAGVGRLCVQFTDFSWAFLFYCEL